MILNNDIKYSTLDSLVCLVLSSVSVHLKHVHGSVQNFKFVSQNLYAKVLNQWSANRGLRVHFTWPANHFPDVMLFGPPTCFPNIISHHLTSQSSTLVVQSSKR